MNPPASANARKMVTLLLGDAGREKTASWLIGQGVRDPRGTADELGRSGYLVHVEDSSWELGVRYTLVGRQGALAV